MNQQIEAFSSRNFSEPWHARLFALTLALHESGMMTWPEWTDLLGAAIAESGPADAVNQDDQYFLAWRLALERLLESRGVIAPNELLAVLDCEAPTQEPDFLAEPDTKRQSQQ